MQSSIEQKQAYLRLQIIEKGLEPNQFMQFMGKIKNEGADIELKNWSIQELKEVVLKFKNNVEEIATEQILPESNSVPKRRSTEVMSKILHSSIKPKKENGLWDWEIKDEQDCIKTAKYIDIPQGLQLQIEAVEWQTKTSGGFIFGFGSTTQLWITLKNNMSSKTIKRKGEDFDWLRQRLVVRNLGSFVPPLQVARSIEPKDQQALEKRVKSVIKFINCVLKYDYMAQSIVVERFLMQTDYSRFNDFKNQESKIINKREIGQIETIQGKFKVQISKQALKLASDSFYFGKKINQVYSRMNIDFIKILSDMENLSKHTLYVSNDFAQLHQMYETINLKCGIKNSNLTNICVYLNNLYSNLGNTIKQNMSIIKQMNQNFVTYQQKQWQQLVQHEKRQYNAMENYWNFKSNLRKKKQRYFPDQSKWDLSETDCKKIVRQSMTQEQIYECMLPKQNRIEEEMRIWQGYMNNMYRKSLTILLKEDEISLKQSMKKYLKKLNQFNIQSNFAISQFNQIFL